MHWCFPWSSFWLPLSPGIIIPGASWPQLPFPISAYPPENLYQLTEVQSVRFWWSHFQFPEYLKWLYLWSCSFFFNWSISKCPQTRTHGADRCYYCASLPPVHGSRADDLGMPRSTMHKQEEKETECGGTPLWVQSGKCWKNSKRSDLRCDCLWIWLWYVSVVSILQ